MKITKKNSYGINHRAMNKKFTGNLTFLNTFDVFNEYKPTAIYKVEHPDTAKGHKPYLLFNVLDKSSGIVRGATYDELLPYAIRVGLKCLGCSTFVWSSYRHDYDSCVCGNVAIDGGIDYTGYTIKGYDYYQSYELNLLSGVATKVGRKTKGYNPKYKVEKDS